MLVDKLTGNPSDGALPVSVIVAVEFSPDLKDDGAAVMLDTAGGKMVMAALRVSPRALALRITNCCVATGPVSTRTVSDDRPSGMVIVDNATRAESELTKNVTSNPLPRAGPESVIVAVDEVPPVTVAGLNTTDTRDGWPCALATTGRTQISRAIDAFMIIVPVEVQT